MGKNNETFPSPKNGKPNLDIPHYVIRNSSLEDLNGEELKKFEYICV